MLSINFFYICATSFLTALMLVPPITRLSVKIGGMDQIDERKVHTHEVSRLGGIAIIFGILFTLVLFADFNRTMKGFLGGLVVIFLTGLVDDLVGISPLKKLAGQLFASLLAVFVGGIQLVSLGDLIGLGEISLGNFAGAFSVFAIVGVMNAINMIDGLDGLAGGVSAVACVAFGLLALKTGNNLVLLISVAVLGATLGFMKYNTYPAVIFMGDSGSLVLGYCMGCLSILLIIFAYERISPCTPLIILAIPILDTLMVMGQRVQRGVSIFAPDMSHFHHRLLDLGFGHKATVLLVYGISYFLACVAQLVYGSLDSVLFLGLLVGASLLYGALAWFASHGPPGWLLLARSNQPIRESATYRRIVGMWQVVLVNMKYIVLLILGMGICIGIRGATFQMPMAFALLALLGVSYAVRSIWANTLLQTALYLSGVFIVFEMETHARELELFGVSLHLVSHALFFILLLLVVIKIFIRQRITKLVSSPFEYFIYFVIVFIPLLPENLTAPTHLLTVASKSVILFAAYKLLLMRQMRRNRKVILATCLVLFIGAIMNILDN